MPRLSASPEQKRGSVAAREIASTNTTANAFFGSKRPAWLTANARPPASGPAPAPTAAPTTNTTSSSTPTGAPATAQSVAPPPSSQPAPAEAPPPSSPTLNPADPKTADTNLSQSDSSLLSPAPTDEASPSAASPAAAIPPLTNTEESSRINDFPSLRRALSEERRRRAADNAQPMAPAREVAENEATNEQRHSPMPANDVAGPPQRASTPTATASTSAAAAGAVTEATIRSSEDAGQARFVLISPDDAVSRPPAPTWEAAVEAILAEASTPAAPPTTVAPTPPAPAVSAPATTSPSTTTPVASTPAGLAASAPPASPSRSGSYFPRLIIRAQYRNEKFKYAPWVPAVQRQIGILEREGVNFTHPEILRMSTLVNTCQTEDRFFVAANQLLSLWQMNPSDVHSRMCSLQPHIINSAFSILQKVLQSNGEIRLSLLKWMSEFPRPVDVMLADDIKFDRVILQVAAFLKKLVQHWGTMEKCVMARGYPLLVDELLSQLVCISPTLQKYMSEATRRNFPTIESSNLKPEEIFLGDQKQHQSNPNTLISLPEDRFEQFLEQINAATIVSYRKCLQTPQEQPRRGRGRPPKQYAPQSPTIFGYAQKPPGPSTAQTGQQPVTASQAHPPNQIQQTQQAQQISNAQRQSQQFLHHLTQVPFAFSSQPGVPGQSNPQTSSGSLDISASYLPIGVSNIAPVPRTTSLAHPISNGTQPMVAHHTRRSSRQHLQQQQQLQLQVQQSSRPHHQGSPVMMGPPTNSKESPFSRHTDTVSPGPASPHVLQCQSPQLADAQQNIQQAQQAHQDAANHKALMAQRAQVIQAQQMHIQVPSHQVPSHQVPSHQVPSHQVPSHQVPSHQVPSHQVPSHQVPLHHPSQQAQFAQVPSQQSMPQQNPGQQRPSVATASLEEKKKMLAYHQAQEKLRLEENHRQQLLQLQREQEEQEAQRQQHTQQAQQAHQALLAQQSQQHQQIQQWQQRQLQLQLQQQAQDAQSRQSYQMMNARQQLELQGQPARQVYQGQQHPLQQQAFIQNQQQQYPQQHQHQHPQQNPLMQAQMQHLRQAGRIQQMLQMQQHQSGQPAPEAQITSPIVPHTQSWWQPMQGTMNPTGQPGRMVQTGRPIQPSLPHGSPHSPAQSPVQPPNLAQQAFRPSPAGPPAMRQTLHDQNATAVSNNALVQPPQVSPPPQPVAALPAASNTANPPQKAAGVSPFGMLVPQAQPQQQRQLPPGPQQQRGRPSRAAPPPGSAQRKWPSTSIFQPPGATISRSEFPLDPNDFRASQMSLTQLDRRSPPRVVINRDTNKVISPKGSNPVFYQFVQGLALGPYPIPMRKTMYSFKFSISEKDFASHSFRSESVNGSRLQVENHFDGSLNYRVRCCTARRSVKAITESDWVVTNTQWPVNIFIKINGTPVFVRRQSRNGKDLPVGITRLVKPGVNTVEVAIPEETVYKPSASTNYFFAVETIETAHSNRTLDYIKTHRVDEPKITIDKIKARLQPSSNKDDEFAILQDSVSVDLADPFSARIFEIPVRGDQCTHIECFDMYNWFSTRPASKTSTSGGCMHRLDCDCPKTQEPTVIDKWKCPICSKDARPRSLRVDRFLVDVRAKLKEEGKLGKVKSILVGADGEWKPVAEDEEDDGNDDSGDDEASTAGAGTDGGINVAKRKQGAQQQQNGQPPRKVSRTNSAPSVVASAARPVPTRQIDVIEIDD